ncbi:MAG: hypothetical protein QOH46_1809, partial [Solirubrobacteraceae bacterium]|jgi:hypothetical protein|nr:hypothetical protein [Solirubrobacteraceae bacterium]
MSQQPRHSDDQTIQLRLDRDEAQALLLAVDAIQPLLERIRAEIAPPPEQTSEPVVWQAPDHDDAVSRVTRLARESLREARVAIGERRITPAQRKAWQEAARRYATAARRSVAREETREPSRSGPDS